MDYPFHTPSYHSRAFLLSIIQIPLFQLLPHLHFYLFHRNFLYLVTLMMQVSHPYFKKRSKTTSQTPIRSITLLSTFWNLSSFSSNPLSSPKPTSNLPQKPHKQNHTSPSPSSTFTRNRAQRLLHWRRSDKICPDLIQSKVEPHPVPVPVPTQEELYRVPVHFARNNASQEFFESEDKSLVQDDYQEYCESDLEDKDLVKDLCKKSKLYEGLLKPNSAKEDIAEVVPKSFNHIKSMMSKKSSASRDLQ
ncbi:unnamed protein product [Vicia faba]|uniref:Uncharacterized protein n=1 Tax=Vicia faba TaxID=3906 RepID=A0AAV0YNX2_VICFA|nr:unnamed protein product [Vicia faba]